MVATAAHAAPWSLSGALVTHDPGIYRSGSTYWIFETTANGGIGVKYSGDGRAWTQGGPIFSGGLSWWRSYNPASAPAQVWAPGCIEVGSRAACYYAVSNFGSQTSAIGLTTSAGGISAGKWVDAGPVITSKSGSAYNAIDPQPVADASGKMWLSFGSFWNGIYITQVDATSLKPTGSMTNIARDSAGIENSFIVRHTYNGTPYYYLFISKGSCCNGASSTYHIVVGRSASITGPYVDDKGASMMSSGAGLTIAASGGRYIAPGGESLVNDTTIAWHALDASNG